MSLLWDFKHPEWCSLGSFGTQDAVNIVFREVVDRNSLLGVFVELQMTIDILTLSIRIGDRKIFSYLCWREYRVSIYTRQQWFGPSYLLYVDGNEEH